MDAPRVEVQVLDQEQMAKLGMGAILGVAQGSVQEPYMVVMKYDGDPDASDKRPVAFIGKGVTFDTGGISIKPAAGMEEMTMDMGGAGVVAGVMRTLALVGKGVTFDTGGISIKPAAGMEDMKWDMGGAAAVAGAMLALAKRGAKANVIGVMGLVENMPDGNAQRPGGLFLRFLSLKR